MAYGKRYRFAFDSQNGSAIEIYILKKNYIGDIITRSLGRAPILKRENNKCIYGTSLELYAECKVDGEFASLYTSLADEYKVEVYKDGEMIWTGFISPELYSEPDIAPPYDVRIIATDGLGELRRSDFIINGTYTLEDVIKSLLGYTNLSLGLQYVSTLKADGVDAMTVLTNLSEWNGESCYEVLQRILASIHAVITQHNSKWVLLRETDLRHKANKRGLTAKEDGSSVILSIEDYGSAQNYDWWPIGNLTHTIEPANNRLIILSKTLYLNPYTNWQLSGQLLDYIESEKSYIFRDASNSDLSKPVGIIEQTIESKHNFDRPMTLRFKAELTLPDNLEEKDSGTRNINLQIKITTPSGTRYYNDLYGGVFSWNKNNNSFDYTLSSGKQDVEITFPLSSSFSASKIYFHIFRDRDAGEIKITDIGVVAGVQYPDMTITGKIANNARGEAEDVDIIFPTSLVLESTSNPQDTVAATPLNPSTLDYVTMWSRDEVEEASYSVMLLTDYAESVALPRMSVTGKLNVPVGRILPLMFERDDEYYILKNYSFDLRNDEMEISLLSIPNAKVTVESIVEESVSAAQTSSGSISSGGNAGGSGGGEDIALDTYMSDFSTNGVQNKVIKAYVDSAVTDIEKELDILNEWKSLKESVLAKFTLDANGNVYLDGNLVVKGDTASGGSGDPSTNQGIDIEELKKYLDDNRYIDENELLGYGYATQTYVDTKTNTLSTALGNAISSKADKNSLASVATSGKYSDLSGLPTLGSLASKNSLAVADIPDLSSVYLPKSGGTMSGDIAMSVNTFLRDEVGNAMIGYNGTLVRVGNTARATDIKGSSVTINGNTPITSANISNQSVASAKSLVTSNSLTFADFTYSTVNIGAGTYSNYQTHIYGNAIRLRYGNNGEIGLILNSSGNITVGNTDVASTDYRFYVYGNMRVREQALVGSLKIGTPNDNFFATLKMDGSSLSIDKELKLLAGGTSDICPSIAASFKAKIAQIQNLVANNVIIGASSGTASNLAFNVQKYTSISSQAPAGLTTLFSIGTDGKATFNGDVVVNGNLIVSGDTSSGGSGNNIPASGIISIKVNGIAYEPTNGIVTLPDYPSSLAWSSISGKPTSLAGYGIIDGVTPTQLNSTLAGYMPTTGGTFSGEITAFNLAISNTGTGYHLQFKRGGGNIIWCPSGGYYRIVCNGAGTSDGDATLLIKSGTVSVKGNLSASGTVSQGSDIRFKDIIEHNTLKIEDIANAPCFSFKWNDRDDDSIHLGTSAQYWEDIAPELVSGSDFKTLNYASLGVAMGISLAKKAQNHEERIKMLEEENKALKAEIRRINNGICN